MLRACCRPRVGARIVSHALPNNGPSANAVFALSRRTLGGLPTGAATDGLSSSTGAAGGADITGSGELPWMKQFKETRRLTQPPLHMEPDANAGTAHSPAP